MILHVKMYGSNSEGWPADWPAVVVEAGDADAVPQGYSAMSVDAYASYRAARAASAAATRPAPGPAEVRELVARAPDGQLWAIGVDNAGSITRTMVSG